MLNFTKLVFKKLIPEVYGDYSDFLKSKTENEEEDVRVMLGYFN